MKNEKEENLMQLIMFSVDCSHI